MLRRVRERHGIESLPVIMFSGKTEDDHEKAQPGARTRSSASRSTRSPLVEQAKALLRVRVTMG